jgi:hypothetical protein
MFKSIAQRLFSIRKPMFLIRPATSDQTVTNLRTASGLQIQRDLVYLNRAQLLTIYMEKIAGLFTLPHPLQDDKRRWMLYVCVAGRSGQVRT